MKFRAFGILLAAVIGIGSAGFSYAAWVGAPSNPPSSNTLGPVWLQPGAPTSQVGNFRISGEGTSDRFIGTNTGDAIRSAGDIWMTNNSKAIKLQQAGNGTINMGNWDPSATGFSLGVYGNIDVAGFGGSNGTLAVTQICLKNDTCRTTWPTASAVSDIWVDVTGDTMTGDLIVPNHQVAAKTLWAGSNLQVQRPASTNVFRTGSWDGTYDNFMEFISDPAETQTLKFFTDAVGPNVGQNAMQIRLNNTAGPSWRAAYMDGSRSGNVDRELTFIGPNGALGFAANTPGTAQQRVGGLIGYCPGGVTPCAGITVTSQNVGGNSQGGLFYNTAGNNVILADPNYSIYGLSSGSSLIAGYFENTAVNGRAVVVNANQSGGVAGLFTGSQWGIAGSGAIGGVFTGISSGISVSASTVGGQFWGQKGIQAYGTESYVSGGSGVYGQNDNGFGVQGSGVYGGFFLGGTAGLSAGNTINTNKWMQLGTNSFGAIVSGNMQVYGGGTASVYIGDQGCGAGYAGFQVNSSFVQDCQRYNLLGGLNGQTFINAFGGQPIYFRQQNGTMAIINSSGDMGIGIGVGTPYGRLELKGPRDPLLTLNADSGYNPAIHYRTNGTTQWYTWANQANNDFIIGNPSKNPLVQLHQNPTSAYTFTMYTNNDLPMLVYGTSKYGYMNTSAGAWYFSSDERLKKDIETLQPGLDTLIELRPVTYKWKEDSTGDVQVGFIAQDVEKVLPNLVGEGPDGYKTLDKEGMIPYMVKAIQELKAENDQLKARLDALEAK